MPLRLLLADDHPLILWAYRYELERCDDFEIVAEVHTGSQVLPRAGQTSPDVVLLDIGLPELDGLECLARLRAAHPEIEVVICSGSAEPEQIAAAREAGAAGYIVKSLAADELPAAVRCALETGEFVVLGAGEVAAGGDELLAGLSDRELSMLRTLARGLSNKAIGSELWITEQTVKFHLTNIYRKLGVENRTQATRVAFEHGLV
jgi:two-component system, NarL family, response regulator DevR